VDYYWELEEKSGVSPTKALASSLGVSRRTVQRWAKGGIQSCNSNAEEIIRLALLLVPREAAKILQEDLETHRTTLHANLATVPGLWRHSLKEDVVAR